MLLSVISVLAVLSACFHALAMLVLAIKWPHPLPPLHSALLHGEGKTASSPSPQLRSIAQRGPGGEVSIIIAARNEAANLPDLLTDILSAIGPSDELVLVLDRCTDGSEALARTREAAFGGRLSILIINELPAGWSGKKWALQQGLQAAKHPWLLFTDADCRVEAGWVEAMRREMLPGREVVLGVGMYRSHPGWLNRLVRFETVHTAWLYIGLARLGMPYMGVGRNLALKRQALLDLGGYAAHHHRLSGDDDLTVNALARAHTTGVCVHPQAVTWSEPERTWRAWLHQKRRHLSASGAYRPGTLLVLGMVQGSFVAAIGLLLAGMLFPATFVAAVSSYVCRTVMVWVAFSRVAQKVQQTKLIPFFPLLEIAFFCYSLFVIPTGILTRPNQWKK